MLPSATANDTPHELSALEVDETIADFAQAAVVMVSLVGFRRLMGPVNAKAVS